jgi:hypothetical protein
VSKKKTGDEVGYGKPPKEKQFQKGASGNPKGRPKKCRNFDEELIRESESLMFITENGRRKRISKHKVAVKQLMKLAMSGNIPAARIYFGLYLQALERIARVAGPQPDNSGKYNPRTFTDEELMKIIADDLEKKKRGSGR